MNDTILKWHRRLALLAVVEVILSSLCAMLRLLMTKLRPAPEMVDHRVPPLGYARAPGDLIAAHGIVVITDLRVVSWARKSYYQIALSAGCRDAISDSIMARRLPIGSAIRRVPRPRVYRRRHSYGS